MSPSYLSNLLVEFELKKYYSQNSEGVFVTHLWKGNAKTYVWYANRCP